MLYLSYGSNMSSKRLRRRAPSAEFVAVAALRAHSLRFHKKSDKDGTAKCDAFFTGDKDHCLFGVVYRIDERCGPALDTAEGLGAGYEKKRIVASPLAGGRLRAFTYYATDIDGALEPLCWYKEHVLRGAQEHSLPRDYIDMIRAVECTRDCDEARRSRELTIYKA